MEHSDMVGHFAFIRPQTSSSVIFQKHGRGRPCPVSLADVAVMLLARVLKRLP